MRIPPPAPGRVENKAKAKGGRVFRLIADERGVTAIEYTLIVALIAIAAVLVIATIGSEVAAPFNTIAGSL